MKQDSCERAALDAALLRLGLQASSRQKELLLKHLALVIEKNKQVNLTRITSFEDAVILHVEDSLSILGEFSQQDGRFVDIGTGAGFPGIPLAVMTDRAGVLLDSVKKKAQAVDAFCDALGLSQRVQGVGMRSEELALEQPASFETVVARAVSSLPTVEELASPLLAPNGRLVAMRGSDSSDDLKTAQDVSERLGLKLVDRREFEIGGGAYMRSVCVFQKVAEPQVSLPRRPGMAAKRPFK